MNTPAQEGRKSPDTGIGNFIRKAVPNLAVRNLLLVGLAYFIIAKYIIKK